MQKLTRDRRLLSPCKTVKSFGILCPFCALNSSFCPLADSNQFDRHNQDFAIVSRGVNSSVACECSPNVGRDSEGVGVNTFLWQVIQPRAIEETRIGTS